MKELKIIVEVLEIIKTYKEEEKITWKPEKTIPII